MRFYFLGIAFLGLLSAVPAFAQWEVGRGKAKMEVFEPGVGMYGYGEFNNRVTEERTPLYARSLLIRHAPSGKFVVLVNCELAFITQAIKDSVVYQLQMRMPSAGFTDQNIMLTATHTHSAPGGYFKYALYNWTVVGFHHRLLMRIVEAVVASIEQAMADLQPGILTYHEGAFDTASRVAYNRSVKSYNRNPEVLRPFSRRQAHLALDPVMRGLKVTDNRQNERAFINWFGVHATAIGNTNTAISSDNKGYAAQMLENTAGGNFLALFAQGSAGDISPHYHGPGQNRIRKKKRNELEHVFAQENGRKQFEKGLDVMRSPARDTLIGNLDWELVYVDLAHIRIDPDFAGGHTRAATSSSSFGMGFIKGTPVDGRGLRQPLSSVVGFASIMVKQISLTKAVFMRQLRRDSVRAYYRSQGRKNVFVNAGDRRILGAKARRFIVPGLFHPIIRSIKQQARARALEANTWAQQIVPIQVFIIGELAIVGLPGEITTIAAGRLRQAVADVLQNGDVKEVIIAPYANAYMGYVTTRQEYKVQAYEGGHTLFGQWELDALRMKYTEISREMLKPTALRHLDRTTRPLFNAGELPKRAFRPGR